MMFEIKANEVEIEGDRYKLLPLTGEYIEEFYSVLQLLQGARDKVSAGDLTEKDFLSVMTPAMMKKLHLVTAQCILNAYPDKKLSDIDAFVSKHLLLFLATVIKINLPQEAEK